MYAVLLKIRHFSDLPYTFETVKFYNKNIVSVWLWFIVLEQFYNNNNINNELDYLFFPKIEIEKSYLIELERTLKDYQMN